MDAVLAQQPIASALPFLQKVDLHGFAMNIPLKNHQNGLMRVDESITSPCRSCLANPTKGSSSRTLKKALRRLEMVTRKKTNATKRKYSTVW